MSEKLFITTNVKVFMRFRGSLIERIAEENEVYLAGEQANIVGSSKVIPLNIYLSHDPRKILLTLVGIFKLTIFVLKKRKSIQLYSTFFLPTMISLFLSTFISKGVVIFIDGLGFSFTTRVKSRLRLRKFFRSSSIIIYRVFRKNIKKVIVLNPADYSICNKIFKISKRKIYQINSVGVDLEKYSFATRCLDENKVVKLGFAGRLHADKGIETLNEAYSELHRYSTLSFSLNIAGESSNNLSGRVLDLSEKNNVIFDGFVNLSTWLSKVDILILPSFREGSSVVLAEALVSGCPVVVANSPGCRHFINKFNLVFGFQVGNVQSLQEAILKCIRFTQDEKSWEALVQNEQWKVNSFFDREKIDAKLIEIIKNSK